MTRWWVCKKGNQPSSHIYTFIYRHKLIASDRRFTVYKTLTNSRACPRNEPCSIRTITNPDKPRIEPGPFSAYYRHLMTKPYKGSRFWCDFEHQLMPLLCNTTRQSSWSNVEAGHISLYTRATIQQTIPSYLVHWIIFCFEASIIPYNIISKYAVLHCTVVI